MNTNIDYWKQILDNPTETYRELFKQEERYLKTTISKNEKVLDVGCGEGRNILSILDITKNVVGIDFDATAFQMSKKLFSKYPEIEIKHADAFDLPFKDEVFDVSILSMTLVNFETKKAHALSEMKRVIKNRGKIILSLYSEKAQKERLKAYKKVNLPIKAILGGVFLFDGVFGANTSEQFSINQIEEILKPLGLQIYDYEEVSNLAYLLTVTKI